MKIKLSEDKDMLSTLVKMDADTGRIIKESPVTVIRNRIVFTVCNIHLKMHKCKQNAIFSTDNSIFSANCCCIAIFQRRKRKFVSVGKSIQHRTVDVLSVVLQDWQDMACEQERLLQVLW